MLDRTQISTVARRVLAQPAALTAHVRARVDELFRQLDENLAVLD